MSETYIPNAYKLVLGRNRTRVVAYENLRLQTTQKQIIKADNILFFSLSRYRVMHITNFCTCLFFAYSNFRSCNGLVNKSEDKEK